MLYLSLFLFLPRRKRRRNRSAPIQQPKRRSHRVTEVAQGGRFVCHYVRAKTASRIDHRRTVRRHDQGGKSAERNRARGRMARAAPKPAGGPYPPRVSCRRRTTLRAVAGDTLPSERGCRASLGSRTPDPDLCRGSDAGRAEINFPGLCKSWRRDCAGIKVGSAPNGPRVARELHAGNHRERRALHVTAARVAAFASFCLTSSIPLKRAAPSPQDAPRFSRAIRINRAITAGPAACVPW